jgi:thiamine biosynthesis lipoprotein
MRAATSMSTDVRWTAMGTWARTLVHGPGAEAAAAEVRDLVATLERRWSRFRPDSELSRLNARPGVAVPVSPETFALLADALAWWAATGGHFDPSVIDGLEAAGYDRPFADGSGPLRPTRRAPGLEGLVLDPGAGTVTLPPGVRLDLGGIGKGRAVDLTAASCGHLAGGLVDLGGDLRVWGTPPDGGAGWPIAVDDPRDGARLALLGLAAGAVATSSTLRRRWTDGAGSRHHLIDPATGRPTDGELVSVTVVAGCATGAEVLAKAAIVRGTLDGATALLEEHAVPGLLVPRTGRAVPVVGFADLCWSGPEGC